MLKVTSEVVEEDTEIEVLMSGTEDGWNSITSEWLFALFSTIVSVSRSNYELKVDLLFDPSSKLLFGVWLWFEDDSSFQCLQ